MIGKIQSSSPAEPDKKTIAILLESNVIDAAYSLIGDNAKD